MHGLQARLVRLSYAETYKKAETASGATSTAMHRARRRGRVAWGTRLVARGQAVECIADKSLWQLLPPVQRMCCHRPMGQIKHAHQGGIM